MVFFLSTTHLWISIGILLLIIFGIVSMVFVCACLIKRWKNPGANFYIVEKIPRQNSLFNVINIYRNFKSLEVDSQDKSLKYDLSPLAETLMDSTDLSNKFTNSLLRLESHDDDFCSGASTTTGSPRTYYSTNLSRSNSKCTFVSCSEGSDVEGLI